MPVNVFVPRFVDQSLHRGGYRDAKVAALFQVDTLLDLDLFELGIGLVVG